MRHSKTRGKVNKGGTGLLETVGYALLCGSIGLGMVFLGAMGWRHLSRSSWFKLEEVRLDIHGTLSKAKVIGWARIPKDKSVLALDLDEIRTNLEDHPCISQAVVHRALPRALEITVWQRRPIAVMILGGRRAVYVDEAGKLFSPCGDITPRGLYRVVVVNPEEMISHPERLSPLMEKVPELVSLLKMHRSLEVSYIKVHPQNGLILALRGGPKEVFMGMRYLAVRLDRLMRIRLHLKRRGEWAGVKEIDLRYAHRADVRFG